MEQRARLHPPRRVRRWASLLMVLAATLFVACSGDAPHVPPITIVNPTSYNVEVRMVDRFGSVLLLGTVSHGSSLQVEEVLDLGPTWEFRFSDGGLQAGHLVLSGGALERDAWRVSIPLSVGDQLARQGLSPPP